MKLDLLCLELPDEFTQPCETITHSSKSRQLGSSNFTTRHLSGFAFDRKSPILWSEFTNKNQKAILEAIQCYRFKSCENLTSIYFKTKEEFAKHDDKENPIGLVEYFTGGKIFSLRVPITGKGSVLLTLNEPSFVISYEDDVYNGKKMCVSIYINVLTHDRTVKSILLENFQEGFTIV